MAVFHDDLGFGGDDLLALPAQRQENARLPGALRAFILLIAGVVALLALVGLYGWLFGNSAAVSGGLGTATMKVNTALCFLASAGALMLATPQRPSAAFRFTGYLCAAFLMTVAGLTLLEYLTAADLGIDQFLYTDSQTPADKAPGRMSAITALEFLLFGAAYCVTSLKSSRAGNICFVVLTALGLVIALTALIGYLYETPTLYNPVPAASIAFTTAITFFLLFLGILALRPELGILGIFLSSGIGGTYARRVLPALIVIPPLLGWLLLKGHEAGFYDNALALSLFAIVSVLALSTCLWIAGSRSNRLDTARLSAYDALEESERRLGESEQRYRNMVELIDIGIWIEVEGIVSYANACMARLVGAPDGANLVDSAALPFIHEEDRAQAEAFLRAARDGAEPGRLEQFRLLGPQGNAVWVEFQAIGYQRQGQTHLICICRDVTAHREAEKQLRHAQKMQAIGELTGGVAHDFNNLLTVIIGNLDIVAERSEGAVLQAVESAQMGAERGAILTQRLLAFSRQQPLSPERLDLNELIESIGDLIRRTLGETVETDMKTSSQGMIAYADRHQVENALLNLVINARDAMPEGGKLTIETGRAYLDEDYAARNTEVTPGDYVVIAVTDTGVGMPASVIERAFEPFFTTKELGKGTGLGLSMVYGFIKQSNGHLKIYSEIGSGTTLRMYLPSVDPEPETAASQNSEADAERPAGGETILVVEDDHDVRSLVVRQLESLGYRVIQAESGPQAQRLLAESPEIDLLFTDVVMPGGMTGRQLSEAAKQLRPRLKTLFTSGYTQNSIVHQGRLDEGISFLAKPYRLKDLSAKIREVLD